MYVLAMGDPVRTDFGYFGSILSGPDLEQTFLGFKADFCPDREQTFTCIIRGPAPRGDRPGPPPRIVPSG